MAKNKITITKLDFLDRIKNIIETNQLRPKKQKLGIFENVQKY